MQTAQSTIDQAQYSAQVFSGLPAGVLGTLKENLVCPECGRPAFYRRGTDGGRGPCFCARPHGDDCALKSQAAGSRSPIDSDESLDRFQPGQTLVLDLNYGAHPISIGIERGVMRSSSEAHENANLSPGGVIPFRTLRLRSVLKHLMMFEEFSRTPMPVLLPGQRHAMPANELFKQAQMVSAFDVRSFAAFWGQITWANIDRGSSLWLNFGGPHQMSVLIPPHFLSDFMVRYDVQFPQDFKGAFVLVLGQLNSSSQGKPYLLLNELAAIAVLR